MNFGDSKVPSVSNHEFVENAIIIIKQVAEKLNKAPLDIFERPLSDAIFELQMLLLLATRRRKSALVKSLFLTLNSELTVLLRSSRN